ncbi:MAG: tRNA uridine-5-carboxymethylaminomethyl(34) synthesis GTPase MnmE [Bacilli bacterium]|jgi:tRNA modification GTPase
MDTIAAISTALGVGAISIIRVSGEEAIVIVDKLFKGANLLEVASHTINYGYIIEKGETIDEVLVSVMKAPRTFTKEDVVEINCHGGINTTNKVLALVLSNGARLAEPGEFSKRAFLNGRIDLVEAEGIMDLIGAKTDKMRKLAINQVGGKVSNLIRDLRDKIRDILVNIDVNIDYPEYDDILVVTKEMLTAGLTDIKDKIANILTSSKNSKIIKDGIRTVIIGRPNVGKSSILNSLIEENKAIVTDIPGTTRDIVEGEANIDGILLKVVDTAGIRKTADKIEQLGVIKSMEALKDADLVIVVLNNNEELTDADNEILNKTSESNRIIFINKSDLDSKINKKLLASDIVIYGNTVSLDGLSNLRDKIKEMFNIDQIEKQDFTYLSNARQIGILSETLKLVDNAENAISNDTPVDIIAIDIKKIWELLGNIIGENYSEELIDRLFKQFCLGK